MESGNEASYEGDPGLIYSDVPVARLGYGSWRLAIKLRIKINQYSREHFFFLTTKEVKTHSTVCTQEMALKKRKEKESDASSFICSKPEAASFLMNWVSKDIEAGTEEIKHGGGFF